MDADSNDRLANSSVTVAGWQRLTGYFGLNSLRGRYLCVAVCVLLFLLGAVWVGETQVQRATFSSIAVQDERLAIKRALRAFEDSLWKTEMALQQFLLVPREDSRARTQRHVAELRQQTDSLANHAWAQRSPMVVELRSQLERDVAALAENIGRVLDIQTGRATQFPAMAPMQSDMLPAHQEFLTWAEQAMIEAEADYRSDETQRELYRLFSEARYNASQMIGAFRLWVSSRFGIFGSPDDARGGQANNIKLYAEEIGRVLAKLDAYAKAGKLGLQQEDSFKKMQRAHEQWMKTYRDVAAIHASGQWRADTPLLRDTILPIVSAVWNNLRAIEHRVYGDTETQLLGVTNIADRLAKHIWTLALVGIFLTVIGLLVFERTVRRPIGQVASALRAEAAGEPNVSLPTTRTIEMQDLIAAFDRMRQQVHTRQERLETILNNAAETIINIDEYGVIEGFNMAAERLFQYRKEEVLGKNISIIMPSPYRSAQDSYMRWRQQRGGKHAVGFERELIARRKDGRLVPITLKMSEMMIDGKRLYTSLIADISERKAMLEELKSREQRLQTILDNAAEGIITFDEHGVIEAINDAAVRLFGWTEKELIGQPVIRLIESDRREHRDDYLQHFLRTELQPLVGHEGEVLGRHKDGSAFPVALKITRMDLEGRQLYVGLAADISERKAMLDHLKKMAEQDGLTGLYNRTYFIDELERVVARQRRAKAAAYALLYIDLDNFKYVNDTLGHAAGDRLLMEVANILRKRGRKSDIIARLGGDEFTILLFNIMPNMADKVADAFRKKLADYSFKEAGKAVQIGCSIGVAVITPETESAQDALAQADIACHLAKRGGRNRIHLYTPKDAANVEQMTLDMGWSGRIKQAIEQGGFALACQPIVNTRTREIDAYEVLIRMIDKDNEQIMPSGFLPAAERFGLSVDIDRWVIVNAIKTLKQQRAQLPSLRYSINLSGLTLSELSVCDLIEAKLKEHDLNPGAITFEVTETVAIADMVTAELFLSRLQAIGCRTALDDFGSGMSSFAYLKDLPVDTVKIDGRFVKNLADNPVDQAMVKAMNDIAHALGKQTVAEFVENEAAFNLLAEYGVDYGQGYHLGRPEVTFPCQEIGRAMGVATACEIPGR